MELAQVDYRVAGGVARVLLNRPTLCNAIGPRLAVDLLTALRSAAADPQVRVVILGGAGKAFCAGGDLGAFETGLAGGGFDMTGLVGTLGEVAITLRTIPKPVVAVVQRAAAGAGMGLALLADWSIAAADATFSTAFGRLGLVPDTGVGFVLGRTLGHARATELLVTGRVLTAAEARELGLITTVVPAPDLQRASEEVVARLLAGSPDAFAGSKRQLWRTVFAGFAEHLALEAEQQAERAASADFAEGLQAFRERREPVFGSGTP